MKWSPPWSSLLGEGLGTSFPKVLCSHFPPLLSMDLPDFNLCPGLGVQAAIHECFGEPINFFPILGLKQFFSSLLLGIANSSCPSSQSVRSSKLLSVELQLILGHNNCQRGSSNLWLHQKIWAFISTIWDLILAISIRYSFFSGAMVVLIGCVHGKLSYKKKMICGPWYFPEI
jgi:hypothetical protein